MAKKYIKCPRCELNYILEGEDYCNVCKNEMKHHSESEYDDELLDFDDMDLCPVCGQNYVKEDQPMCDECKKKRNGEFGGEGGFEDDEAASPVSDIDSDEDDDEYNSGFSEVDENGEEIDPFKETSLLDDDSPLDFATEEDEDLDEEMVESLKDDFEVVDVSDDDDDDEDEDEDDYDFEDDDMLGKKK